MLDGGRRRRSSLFVKRPYVIELLISYFSKRKFPEYHFNIETFYKSVCNAIMKKGTSLNINFVQMREFFSLEEYLIKFVPRKEYVKYFVGALIDNLDNLTFLPETRFCIEGELIRSRYFEKKEIENYMLLDKYEFNHPIATNLSFSLKKEISFSDQSLQDEKEVKNEHHSESPEKKNDSIISVKQLAIYLEKNIQSYQKRINKESSENQSKECSPDKKSDSDKDKEEDEEEEEEKGDVVPKDLKKKFRRKSTLLKGVKLDNVKVKNSRRSKLGIEFHHEIRESLKRLNPFSKTPKQTDISLYKKKKRSIFKFDIPDFDAIKFPPTIKFIINRNAQKRKEKEEKEKISKEITSLAEDTIFYKINRSSKKKEKKFGRNRKGMNGMYTTNYKTFRDFVLKDKTFTEKPPSLPMLKLSIGTSQKSMSQFSISKEKSASKLESRKTITKGNARKSYFRNSAYREYSNDLMSNQRSIDIINRIRLTKIPFKKSK